MRSSYHVDRENLINTSVKRTGADLLKTSLIYIINIMLQKKKKTYIYNGGGRPNTISNQQNQIKKIATRSNPLALFLGFLECISRGLRASHEYKNQIKSI